MPAVTVAKARKTEAAPGSAAGEPEEYFRSAVVPIDQLAATLNRWTADGFVADVEWAYLDGEPGGFSTEPQPWVHVWAWLGEPE